MNDDYESFENHNSKKKKKSRNSKDDDFVSIFSDISYNVNWKIAFFLFLLGFLIFSDVFIDLFLNGFSDAVYAGTPTTKGTTIQLLCLTLGYIIIDLLVAGEIL
jgi:hypothetical protein